MKRPFTILAIDGGGIRGIVPAMVLADLERRTGRPTAQVFDLIAGTSTGGMLALALSRPARRRGKTPKYTAEDLVALYRNEGADIFTRSVWHAVHSFQGLADERYPAGGLERVLERYLGRTTLSEALTNVLVTSYDLHSRRPVFFKSHKAKIDPARDFPMTAVARASTAAPTYFEPLHLAKLAPPAPGEDSHYALVDGGVFANSPGVCGYVEARKIDGAQPANHCAEDFLLVSIGTGIRTRKLPFERVKDWGLLGWARPALDIVVDGGSDAVDYQLRHLLPAGPDGRPRYYRFQGELHMASDDLDDASERNVNALMDFGRDLVAQNRPVLRQLARRL